MMRVTDVEWNGVRWVATGGPGKESVLYSDDNGLTWNAITDSSKNLINTGMGIAATGSKNTFATNETIKRLKLNDLSDVMVGSENFENSLKIGSNKTGTLSLAERNTIICISGGNSLTSGTDNTSVGYNTIYSLTTGKDNTAVGSSALESLTTGNYNTALGNDALKYLTTSSSNTAVGDKVLVDCSGMQNTSVGTWSGQNTTIGGHNTFMGYAAGSSITDGSYNVAIGSMSAYGISKGTGNIYIGYQSMDTYMGDSSNAIAIGHKAYSSTNKITIGNTSHTHSTIYGNLTIPGDASFNDTVDISNILKVGYDKNITSYIGRAAIGYSGQNDIATFSHINSNNTTTYGFAQKSNGRSIINAPTGEYITLRINDTDKVRLATDGKFGIGTTDPSALLHVDGDVSFTGYAEIHNACIGNPDHSTHATFSYKTRNNLTDYSLLSTQQGRLFLNARNDQYIRFRLSNVDQMTLDTTGFGI